MHMPPSMALRLCLWLRRRPPRYAHAYAYGPTAVPMAHVYAYGIQWGWGCPDLHNTMPMPMRNTVSSALGADVEPSPRHPSYATNPRPMPISFLLLGPPQLHAHGNG